jgi:hypothetical protein
MRPRYSSPPCKQQAAENDSRLDDGIIVLELRIGMGLFAPATSWIASAICAGVPRRTITTG